MLNELQPSVYNLSGRISFPSDNSLLEGGDVSGMEWVVGTQPYHLTMLTCFFCTFSPSHLSLLFTLSLHIIFSSEIAHLVQSLLKARVLPAPNVLPGFVLTQLPALGLSATQVMFNSLFEP